MGSLHTAFAANLRAARAQRRVSQAELAERCGLSQGYIADLEGANRFPSVDSIERLCRALEIPPYRLFLLNESSELSAPLAPRERERLRSELTQRLTAAVNAVLGDGDGDDNRD